ncbi:MAG: LacI family transcriptional regulator, partial [Lachnospiraceae bacterium]|nr:LacI family transcriptional regulator [Lachnospiraceae bacterium]
REEGARMGVTIRDVAREAGTSVSTVSKVINGHYSISEKTAEHVKAVMRQMNYYPSTSAQSFAKGTTKVVTVLTNLAPDVAFQNPHMLETLAGLEESLRQKGYRLVLRGADEKTSYDAAEEIIARKSSDALVIHISVMTHALSGLLTRAHFPHIVLGAPNFESQVCWIDNNNVYSGTVAASYLISAGYRRIAFLGGQYYDLGSADRLKGVKQSLQDAGIPLEDQYIWLGESTRADGYRMSSQLLEERMLPEAIVCANNYIALGCVAAIQERKMRIPDDIGVIAFDDYPFSQIIDPPLTVVDINVRDMGVQAGKFLVQMIHNPNMQIQTYVTTSNLLIRQSTRERQ